MHPLHRDLLAREPAVGALPDGRNMLAQLVHRVGGSRQPPDSSQRNGTDWVPNCDSPACTDATGFLLSRRASAEKSLSARRS